MNGHAEADYGPRRYAPEPDGLRAMAALVILREKVSSRCLPRANSQSHRPNRTIPPRSITTTNIFGLACGTCLRRWGSRHRIDNSFFIFVNKQLDPWPDRF
jgi:hypothetical protein